MKLVQMPADLVHIEDADLDGSGVGPNLLAAYRAYLPQALNERRGLAILAPSADGAHHLLMLLARRVGAALRDENIRLREHGGDLKAGRQKLCYLPGHAVASALDEPAPRQALAREAACFLQDLDGAWAGDAGNPGTLDPADLLRLLDERIAAGRATFLNADPAALPAGLADELRARLPTLEARAPVDTPGVRAG